MIVEGLSFFVLLNGGLLGLIGQIVANGLMTQSSGSAQARVEGYMARYYLLLSATPLPSFDISLTARPQIITTVDCRSISHIYVICRNFTPYYQFFSQKFVNFKGGGKFAVTIIALIYAYCNRQIYNIFGLYTPYINRAIFDKIRYNSLWHILCILMTICDLHKSIKKV